MTKIIDALPAIVAIDQQIAVLREQERQMVDKSAKARQKYARARAAWEQKAVDDELDGKTPKAPPEPPDDSLKNAVMTRLRTRIEQAVSDRRRAIVEHADEIRAAVDEQGRQILDEARPLVESLTELVARLRGVASAVDEIGGARQSIDGKQTTHLRNPPAVDVIALLHAVDIGSLGPVLDGRDPRPPRTLGLQSGSTLGQPIEPKAEPKPERSAPEQGETVTVHRMNPGAEL